MFSLFQKSQAVIAPISGKVIGLDQVPDAAFAQRIIGDGAALTALCDDTVYAPVDGTLTLVFRTNHAFAITTKEKLEVLVHVGMDTVKMEGEGFERLAEEGSQIKAGQPVLRIDRAKIEAAGYSLVTPVVITSMANVKKIEAPLDKEVIGGKDAMFSHK